MAIEQARAKWRKLLVSSVVGGVVGFLGATAWMTFVESSSLGKLGTSSVVASLIGLIYVIAAAGIGFGVANVHLGARFLNVEDAEELREQRALLFFSGCATAAIGLALIVLAISGPGGVLPAGVALASASVLLGFTLLLSLAQWRLMDELMRSLSREAGSAAFSLITLVGGGWAALAHLGYAPQPSPLDWLSLFAGLLLLAAFIVVGRRGMLMPR